MEFDKSKVYTALNADEVIVGSKGFFGDSILQLEDNMQIEKIHTVRKIWDDDKYFRFQTEEGACYSIFYLVEEPKYRAYKNTDEMIEDYKERTRAYGATPFECPMFNLPIWVKAKERTAKSLIYVFYPRSVYVGDEEEMPLDKLFEYYTYLDGSPCGKKI
jgi:hypothetical protein